MSLFICHLYSSVDILEHGLLAGLAFKTNGIVDHIKTPALRG